MKIPRIEIVEERHVTETKIGTLRLGRKEILSLLKAARPKLDFGSLESVEIFVRIPGGGDWSNTDLEIDDDDTPVIVRYKTTWTAVALSSHEPT